jgi:RNA polymerase sigma-70 factor (ECF subfamily)
MFAWHAGATVVVSLLQRIRSSSPPSAASAEDAALVARAQADLEAFAAIYDRHFAGVYGYCYRELGSVERAEDAAQQVFEQAFVSLPRYREVGKFRSWLYTIAHHVIGAQRGAHARSSLTLSDDFADPASSPEEQALGAVERQELLVAITRLPKEQRLVIELRMAGLKGREIADELGRSHEAVRMLQQRALDRLGADLIGKNQRRGGRHGA